MSRRTKRRRPASSKKASTAKTDNPYLTLARLAIYRWGAIQKQEELESLCRLVHREQADSVLEIGTALGGTFYCWIHVAKPDALLVSVDLPDGMYRANCGDPWKTPERCREALKPEQQAEFIREDSHAPETLEKTREALAGRHVDFLFIDGDHSYEGVRSDFEMYSPLVRGGGLVAFHDIVTHARVNDCHVQRYWQELKREHKEQWEFVDRSYDPYVCGIGVLRIHR